MHDRTRGSADPRSAADTGREPVPDRRQGERREAPPEPLDAALQDDELAHDLRQELAVVDHLVERLGERTEQCPESWGTLVVLRRQVRVLADLVRPFRNRAGRWGPVDLETVVEDVASSAAVVHDAEVRVRAGRVPPVVAPVVLLRRALLNVIVNACEAAPGQPVDVEVREEPGTVVVEVVDRGRTDRDPVDDEPGLGSWVVHAVVRDCRGTVERERTDDGGRRVVVRLPAARRGPP